MPLGPFDSRTKRSRCSACSTSHLKCSGDIPCSNCARRRITCTYSSQKATNKLILVTRGKQNTVRDWPLKDSNSNNSNTSAISKSQHQKIHHASHNTHLAPPGSLTDQTTNYIAFFHTFTARNNFTGRSRTTGDEVKQLTGLHSRRGNHLFNAMLAVGAMYAGKLNTNDVPGKRETSMVAFQHYSYAIEGLREAIDGIKLSPGRQGSRSQEEHVCILWTTFLLGLFELMNDATGHGWQQHIIHGTSMALKSSGPSSCRSGPGLAFFIQARIFEISRTVLFGEPTFLTEPDWVALSRDMWARNEGPEAGTQDSWRPLDSLLDIIVMCSNLRVRAESLLYEQLPVASELSTSEAMAISADGHRLREALTSWSTAYMPRSPPNLSSGQGYLGHDDAADPSTLLARVFYAAISIYLSGVFDYELLHWQEFNLAVPTLDEATVVEHLHTILALTEIGLGSTTLSPVLFLFPLRIAGSRSYHQWQRDRVSALVAQIGRAFVVASAISDDLAKVWKQRPVVPLSEVQPILT